MGSGAKIYRGIIAGFFSNAHYTREGEKVCAILKAAQKATVTSATDDDATTDGEPVERSAKMQSCESCQTNNAVAVVVVTDFVTGNQAMLCNECEMSLDLLERELLDIEPIRVEYDEMPSELYLGQVA